LTELTIRDVARKAGVSVGTVSRVLNRNMSVQADIRQVWTTRSKRWGYAPNFVARSMRSRTTFSVPQLAAFVRAAHDVLHETG
jgi:LacI family transcriptional regulator